MLRVWGGLVLGLAMLGTGCAEPIVGQATVIDGDTIEIRGQRIRLEGIDAPESRQACVRNGEAWRCGQAAAHRLDALIDGRNVHCTRTGTDRYERVLAVCYQGDLDLNGALVAEGLALAYRQYSGRYATEEDEARGERRGLWAVGVQFEMPWEWRRRGR